MTSKPTKLPATGEMQHKIRSFAFRGRMTKGQARALKSGWQRWGLDFADQPIDLPGLFSNTNPITLEIGFGSGDSLASQAAANPNNNFLGVEVHQPGLGHLLMQAEALALTNLRVINHDAVPVLQLMIAPGALACIQIFFPDPWPRRRHHKRRLVQQPFLDLAVSRLEPGGLLHLATDWPHYAESIAGLLSAHPGLEKVAAPPRLGTRFEQKGKQLQHEITDLAARKHPLSAVAHPTSPKP